MGTVTGYTAARMKRIEDASIVNAELVSGHLILSRFDESTIDVGDITGPQGLQGLTGATSIAVCTSSTRPTGGDLFTGLAIYETDTKLVYIWDGAAWTYRGGTIICTSTTHPSNPIAGLPIYETDTDKFLIYNGYRFDPPWNSAWGLVAPEVEVSTSQSGIGVGPTNLNGLRVEFTTVANRLLRGHLYLPWVHQSTSASGSYPQITLDDNTILQQAQIYLISGGYAPVTVKTPKVVSTDDLTAWKARIGTTSGTVGITCSSTQRATFYVEDVGPAGDPVA